MKGRINKRCLEFNEVLKNNKMWMKDSMDGEHSLMRAISSSLFFTENLHSQIQSKVIQFFCCNYKTTKFKFLEDHTIEKLMRNFLDNPQLHEFESVNIEIVAHLFNCQIKLYTWINNKFYCEIFFKKTKRNCRIFRLGWNNYSPVFKEKIEELSGFCQGLILGITERIFDPLFNLNKFASNKKFVNIDLKKWED